MSENPKALASSQMLNRREFMVAASLMPAAIAMGNPVPTEPLLDIHQHTNYAGRTDQELVAHQAFHEVTTTVLLAAEGWMLTEAGDNTSCAKVQADFPDMFVRFACADVAESRTADVLRGNVHRGAIGFGELKFHVAVDSPEMHRVYKLAEELQVPVLLHFQNEMYNTGIERFESILKTYPRVTFIGHAQTWWGNISADLDPTDLYPKGRVKPGGLTDRLLSDYPNIYGDLSAGSGANALTRDPDFAQDFLERHYKKLLWGSDCPCRDGKGEGEHGVCIATTSLTAIRKLVPDDAKRRRILYENGAALYHLTKV